MAEQKSMRMYYDKTQSNTQITVKEWDHLCNVLPFEMTFWKNKIEKNDGESDKDYHSRVLDKVIETTNDEIVQKMNSEGRIATLKLLSNPNTSEKVKFELRRNLEKINNKTITSEQGTMAVFRSINPEELKKIQSEAIRAHLESLRKDEKKTNNARKMNVH
jgi:hypothetical protein